MMDGQPREPSGISARSWLGRPVVDLETGEELAVIEGLILEKPFRLGGFRLKKQDGTVAFLPREKSGGGEEVILVKAEDVASGYPPTREDDAPLGRVVVTGSGKVVGHVYDLYFSPDTGELGALEVSDGLLKDLVQGRRLVPCGTGVVWGERVILDNGKGAEDHE